LLIGRTRTGKSTFQKVLVDPTTIPAPMNLMPGGRYPRFESFYIAENKMMLNIIDCPGLFERGRNENDIRKNKAIMRTMEECICREITKLHVICFCMSLNDGLHQEDIESVQLLVKFLGEEVSNYSCLIITRSESMGKKQQQNLLTELRNDVHFRQIEDYFQKGIFFSGAINRDHFDNGYEIVKDQFEAVNEFRNKLLDLFVKQEDSLLINEMVITTILKPHPPRYEK